MNASPLNAELYSCKFFWTVGLVSSNKLKMPSNYLFYLGLVLTSVVANDVMNTTQDSSTLQAIITTEATDPVVTSSATSTTASITTKTSNTLETSRSMNAFDRNTNTTSTPGDRNKTQTSDGGVARTTIPMKKPSSKPTPINKNLSSTTKHNPTTTKMANKSTKSSESTGIIIVVVIALVIVAFGVVCFVSRRRGRRYSVDFAASPDENVPLSTIHPEVRAESAPQNGLKSFDSTETAGTEPKGPEVAPETQEEKKEEAAISTAAPSAEAAAPPEAAAASASEAAPSAAAPSPDSSEVKPKADDAKQSSSAPVDPLAEEKTDDEGAVSNKTSVESLKETNENNSNNSGSSQRRAWQRSNTIWEVGVDCPV
ncbi:nuclear pore complex protein DDB_G0274915 [Xiphophorus hellerii]|uniref:nuclear pore complex protein DDB_G0274915 n=1 Tax=Xiphophorus hellerii TaxID=8084 RepID=UPI0013B41AD1|nr:nuclear pore complex protein DDB_G0274915-like [Xiphophorus hellerii]